MKQQGWMDEAVNDIVETHLILHFVQYYLAHVPVCEWDKCSSWRNTGYGNTLTAEILLRSGRQGNQWTFTVHGLHLSPHRSHLDYYTPSRSLKTDLHTHSLFLCTFTYLITPHTWPWHNPHIYFDMLPHFSLSLQVNTIHVFITLIHIHGFPFISTSLAYLNTLSSLSADKVFVAKTS